MLVSKDFLQNIMKFNNIWEEKNIKHATVVSLIFKGYLFSWIK